ncbi:MAG: leucyl aminopeptidase family protein, partial [Alphaproteobacteria bacterium]|nr:leucyl aminopeptidase family protein [Alphaproteobacteria bacterium]
EWVRAAGFKPETGAVLLLPDGAGRPAALLAGLGKAPDLWSWAAIADRAPAGLWRLATEPEGVEAANAVALGWGLGRYRFARYKTKAESEPARLIQPAKTDRAAVARAIAATVLVRDLVNTPASDMGPAELAEAAVQLAKEHGASHRVLAGDELLTAGYPSIHAVGRAAARAPRLIDLTWGDPAAPKVTLVGKGVCFDSGGLDLKPAAGMRLMKKDMGGAATVLGLASMVMAAKLKLRLRVLIPAVENAVSGSAYRPGDILKTRSGTTVEIGNTDAEGRVILCDALAEADSENPALLIDCATLTGAARVALGPDLPALFTPNDALADDLLRQGRAAGDPLWRMPLWAPYRKTIEPDLADLSNSGDSPHAGAVTAALFLQAFVAKTTPWAHLDLYAWRDKAAPGRPAGGEALGMRALYRLIAARFGG